MSIKMTEECRVAKKPCPSCPFAGWAPLALPGERMAGIATYLAQGENHMCHSDESHRTVCRWGRDLQLRHWHNQGIIAAPTDEALADAMRAMGIVPGRHISSNEGNEDGE